MEALLAQPWVKQGAVFLGVVLVMLLLGSLTGPSQSKKIQSRIARIQGKKKKPRGGSASAEQQSLRRQTGDTALPTLGRLLEKLPNLDQFRARLEKAGFSISPERYVAICLVLALLVMAAVMVLGKKALLGFFIGIIVGAGLPHLVVGIAAGSRIKRFIALFPDAIDLIVRGLRSGLPVTESFQMVAQEVQEPVGTIFGGISESIRLGVPAEKALQDMARKLGSTEFNFFVTSIILQRETGGNLSEILSNLSEVLRNRAMMRLKIKALSSEAKASAIIVGALPFLVILALSFIQPNYLTVLITDFRGNLAAGGAACSLFGGMFIMLKMTKFEI